MIIQNKENYVRSWDDVEIFPEALQALSEISHQPYEIIIVTNQSAVGRGLISIKTAREINRRLVQEIEDAGGRVDAVYMCPHKPSDNCRCRKPEPGLLLQAAEDRTLHMEQAVMIGDAISDLQAGLAAGVQTVALVLTGRGESEALSSEAQALQPFPMFDDLSHALKVLLNDPNPVRQS